MPACHAPLRAGIARTRAKIRRSVRHPFRVRGFHVGFCQNGVACDEGSRSACPPGDDLVRVDARVDVACRQPPCHHRLVGVGCGGRAGSGDRDHGGAVFRRLRDGRAGPARDVACLAPACGGCGGGGAHVRNPVRHVRGQRVDRQLRAARGGVGAVRRGHRGVLAAVERAVRVDGVRAGEGRHHGEDRHRRRMRPRSSRRAHRRGVRAAGGGSRGVLGRIPPRMAAARKGRRLPPSGQGRGALYCSSSSRP